MTESIFRRLEDEWHDGLRHVTSRFHHESSTLEAIPQSPQDQEPAMPLADLAAAMKTDLEDGLTKLHTVLDEHMPQLEQLVAIADHELMQKVEQAIPVVPPQILSGIGTMLDAVIAEHAKPEEGPAEAAQAAAAEPQQVEQPAA